MPLFRSVRDYQRFIYKMNEFNKKNPVGFYIYCLMPNHYHFLLRDMNKTGDKVMSIPNYLKNLQYSHARFFNRKYDHSGHVFESEYKCKRIKDDSHFIQVVDYIYNNPVRAGLTFTPEQWAFSKKFTR